MVDYINSKKQREDYCVDELIKIVAKGSSILTEVLRMKDYIPEVYEKPEEIKKYQNIIFDFTYFDKVDFYEEKIKNNQELRNLDEEFRDNNLELLERFFLIFKNIYTYILELEAYFASVKQGAFVQHTLENLLTSKSSRHLICESVYLYGAMLLIVDKLIPGPIRERIIISYYRNSGQSTIKNITEIVGLFKSTGYSTSSKPKNYPKDYFARHKLDKELIKMIIGTIKDNDIYEQIAAFPSPEHRSHALSTQASMIFTVLFFITDYLDTGDAKMREIVDKHFSDNWVVSVYMGYHIDILDYWKDLKAAKNALSITITPETVKSLASEYKEKLNTLLPKLEKYYYEGTINENYVLDHINVLLGDMREANVVLKWYLLQLNTTNKKFKDIIEEGVSPKQLISLLMATSHFEHNLKVMFGRLVDGKEKMWNEDVESAVFRLKELSDYFDGRKNFGKQAKQEDFKDFFEKHLKSIAGFSFTNSTVVGRKIIIMKEELEKIKKYHYVESNLQIKQYINEIIENLNHMLRVVNIKNKVLVNISQISDFSYAWITIQDYAGTMQELLRTNSNNILYLKSVFLKLASILNFPLIRLFEAESPDIESVTNHYSTEIVNFVRNVLQIVPISVFKILEQIIAIYNKGFKETPIKILKADIQDYAQLDERHELAKCVHLISLFTKGILAMEKTLVGIIEVDPKEILEDGIRRELLKLLATKFHQILDLNVKSDIKEKLTELGRTITAIRRGFIYIQDYININGSRIWTEEMHRMINCYTDLEANKFLTRKIRLEPKYNLLKYNIPKFLIKDDPSASFLGRLIRFVVGITSPKNSVYYPTLFSWYDWYNKEVFSLKYLYFIKDSMGIEGFQGIFRLLGYNNHHSISLLSKAYIKYSQDKNKPLQSIAKLINKPLIFDFADKETIKNYLNGLSVLSKNLSTIFLPIINSIGHQELLKFLVGHCLKESVEYESNCLFSQISNMNKHFLSEIKLNKDPIFKEDSNDQKLRMTGGVNDPHNQGGGGINEFHNTIDFFKLLNEVFIDFGLTEHSFYIDMSKHDYLVSVLAMITVTEININYVKDMKERNGVRAKFKEEFSFSYFIFGIKTILYQMGRKNTILYFSTINNLRRLLLLNSFTLKELKVGSNTKIDIPENLLVLDFIVKQIQTKLGIDAQEIDLACGLKTKLH